MASKKVKSPTPKQDKGKPVEVKKDGVKQVKSKPVKEEVKTSTESRKNVSSSAGINLSVPRVRRHVDKGNINQHIEKACVEIKGLSADATSTVDINTLSNDTKKIVEQAYSEVYEHRKKKNDVIIDKLKNSKKPEDVKKVDMLNKSLVKPTTISDVVDMISKMRCRFSTCSTIVLSSALDYVITQLITNSMYNVQSDGKAIIQISHMLNENVKKLDVYPLIHNLDTVQKNSTTHQQEERVDDGNNENENENESNDNSANFKFYVNLIYKSVKNGLVESDDKYKNIRISKDISKLCSDIVIELIERMSPLIVLYTNTNNVKTVNDDTIKFILNFIMTDAGGNSTALNGAMEKSLGMYKSSKKTN